MDSLINGVSLTNLSVIAREGGAVLHMLRCDSSLFSAFGEIYFSEVESGVIRGWKRHKRMTQNFTVPVGRVKFVLYDDRKNSSTFGAIAEYELGRPDNYKLLTIPPLVWYAFGCVGQQPGLIANCADLPHDPEESERIDLDSFLVPYKWK